MQDPKFKGNQSKLIIWATACDKITFLPFRLFTYYGSNLGERLKYHYYNTPKQPSLLGLNTFG